MDEGFIEQEGGQLTLCFQNMGTDLNNYVVQSNALILGRQKLSLNEAKLLRLAIMQIRPDSKVFEPCKIKASEFAKLIGRQTANNIYHDVEIICKGIMEKPLEIKQITKNGEKWQAYSWMSVCEYDTENGEIKILLNDRLKPFLIDLKDRYTQYPASSICLMSSVYAIRLFELLLSKLYRGMPAQEGSTVRLDIDVIKEALNCSESIRKSNGLFKLKVIDIAVREIENSSMLAIDYEFKKRGRVYKYIEFTLKAKYYMSRKELDEHYKKRFDNPKINVDISKLKEIEC